MDSVLLTLFVFRQIGKISSVSVSPYFIFRCQQQNVKNLARCLLSHFESHADAIVIFADLADGFQLAVATDAGDGLKQGEQLFRFQEKAHAFWRALDITRKGDEERLQIQFAFVWVVSVRALKSLASQLNGEGLVLV